MSVAQSVFVSHGGADHPLAVALRARLRSAGFDAFVYDSRLFRPPAYTEMGNDNWRVWADETAGERVNISHLCAHIEAAAYVLLIGDVGNIAQIDSWHIQGEIAYAQFLGRVGPQSPAIVALPAPIARMLILEGSAQDLRENLAIVARQGRPLITFARLYKVIIAALLAVVLTAVAVGSRQYALLCGYVVFGGLALLWLSHRYTRRFARFTRAGFLGEVNASAPFAAMLFGHRTRQLHGDDVKQAVANAVVQDFFVAGSKPLRRVVLRAILSTPSLMLFVLLPAVVVVALLAVAYGVL